MIDKYTQIEGDRFETLEFKTRYREARFKPFFLEYICANVGWGVCIVFLELLILPVRGIGVALQSASFLAVVVAADHGYRPLQAKWKSLALLEAIMPLFEKTPFIIIIIA